jgi:hypothetical protein
VEEEWKRGRDRVRERLVEGVEERRRRARERRHCWGYALSSFTHSRTDSSLDPQSRPHITRKLRNKLGTSPPPTPLGVSNLSMANGLGSVGSSVPITSGPVTNPHSLAVDELPSPFPLPLTSTSLPSGHGGSGGVGINGRRRNMGFGLFQSQAGVGGLGKSLAVLSVTKEMDVEADLGEIWKGNKRRRATVMISEKL